MVLLDGPVDSSPAGRRVSGVGYVSDDSTANNSEESSSKSSSGSADSKKEEKDVSKMNTGRWSPDEHKRFLEGLKRYGNGNWRKITKTVGTRTCTQIRTHAQKYFIALGKPTAARASNPSDDYDGDETGVWPARKKSKMLTGMESGTTSPMKPFWGPDGLRDNNTGMLSGMEALAQAAMARELRTGEPGLPIQTVARVEREAKRKREDQQLLQQMAKAAADVVTSYHHHASHTMEEFARLRQEIKNLNVTILGLKQKTVDSNNRAVEAMADRRVALNECENLRENNARLKTELRRMASAIEQNAALAACVGGDPSNAKLIAAAAASQAGFANTELLMRARLKEVDLRYDAATESLSRQTGVLSDQHGAIFTLNGQLQTERLKRQLLEREVMQLKTR